MHNLLYSRNHASLPRPDCPNPAPHQLPCHSASRSYTTLTTRGSIRPFLEPTAPNPHAPLHRGDSQSSAPARSHAILAPQSALMHNASSDPPPFSSPAAPFVSRSTIRPFLEVTVPILHISTFSCRFGTPMHSRLAQLRLRRLHAPLPSRASPISDCLNLPPRHALPGSPVSSRTRLIPKWLPVRLFIAPLVTHGPMRPCLELTAPTPCLGLITCCFGSPISSHGQLLTHSRSSISFWASLLVLCGPMHPVSR